MPGAADPAPARIGAEIDTRIGAAGAAVAAVAACYDAARPIGQHGAVIGDFNTDATAAALAAASTEFVAVPAGVTARAT